jgi:head-tail adaptor
MTAQNAGQMRTRIRFQRRKETIGDRGQSLNEFIELGSRDCKVEFLSGRKLELARELFSRASVRVDLRKPQAFQLTVRDRALLGTTVLTIGSALPSDEKFDDLVLLCEVEQ